MLYRYFGIILTTFIVQGTGHWAIVVVEIDCLVSVYEEGENEEHEVGIYIYLKDFMSH